MKKGSVFAVLILVLMVIVLIQPSGAETRLKGTLERGPRGEPICNCTKPAEECVCVLPKLPKD
ncbi:MAG: hypothetical protein RB296_05420 [Acidobacteriota bacterium]|jgi:hypothetical protein|nr:hypothetical protein [Acidobacteriota bacterium]